jgi:hypothetical protein
MPGSEWVLRRRRVWALWPFLLTVVAATAGPVWAWGPVGHRVTAQIADKRLTPRARAAIAQLLETGESLAEASLWADQHRRELPRSAPWHYVDVPLDEPRYHSLFSGDTPERGYVVDKIHDFKVVLGDTNRPISERRMALRFLVHFVEDLHMPMHVGDHDDKGGNRTQVRFFDRGTNMHSLWDSGMVERMGTEAFWLKDLAAIDSPAAAKTGRPRASWRPAKPIRFQRPASG